MFINYLSVDQFKIDENVADIEKLLFSKDKR